jgi:hypothetical protein
MILDAAATSFLIMALLLIALEAHSSLFDAKGRK